MFRSIAFFILLAASAGAQTTPQLKITLMYDGTLDSANLFTNKPFTVIIQNIDSVPVTLIIPHVGYEEDNNSYLPVFFKTYYFDKYGLTSFNHHCTDIDLWIHPDNPPDSDSTLKAGQSMQLKCNPFHYSCLMDGEKEYRVTAYYRIYGNGCIILYSSNDIRVSIK